MRRLFLDIETSPNVGLFWESGYKLNIPPENIIKERAVICIGYKWAGERRVFCPTWDQDQDDAQMLRDFVPLLDEADEVVAHYGNHFDLPWLRARCVKHGIPMAPRYVTHDTKSLAARLFKFNANNLDYLARFLGVGAKVNTGGFSLWKQVLLDNDRAALTKMVRYCKNDVALLEKVWDKLNPYLPAQTHVGRHAATCVECGSDQVAVNKRRITAAGYRKVQLVCNDCGKYHTVAESRYEKAAA